MRKRKDWLLARDKPEGIEDDMAKMEDRRVIKIIIIKLYNIEYQIRFKNLEDMRLL